MDWRTLLAKFHADYVFNRRTQVLADRIATLLPSGHILDVGCGDGTIDALLHEHRKDLTIEGVDIMVRPCCRISVTPFDGHHLPFPDGTFDAVLLVDVLHHMTDCVPLLRECARVGKSVVLKDHLCESRIDWVLLKLMDWVGNRPHGVVLVYNYLSQRSWDKVFDAVGLQTSEKITRIPLYPFPFSLVFGRRLHFIARLSPGFPGNQS